MTQKDANRIFRADLGRQIDCLYEISDGRIFIRYSEAVSNSKDMIIKQWFRE